MDGGDQNLGSSSSGGSRWNPTKEQIAMLEGLYKQGLRTPTAEQIQQISNRLKDFGHIEGKNVFYWFQNHKARQRQKQKQENLAYFNRFLHPVPPLFPAYHHNVVCSPYCSVAPTATKNHQVIYQKPANTPAIRKRTRVVPETSQQYTRDPRSQNQETLDLFPVHPTGLLQSNERDTENNESNGENMEYPVSIFGSEVDGDGGDDHSSYGEPFFNFLYED